MKSGKRYGTFSIDMPNLKTLKVMVSNSDFLFQENEGLRIDNKYSALQSKVNDQNTCAVRGNDSASSTVSTVRVQVHVIVSINGAFMCSVVTEDVFF